MMTWSAWPDDQRAATEVPRNSGHPLVTLRPVPDAHYTGQRVVIYPDVHGVVRALRSGRLLIDGDGGTISVAQKRSCSRMSKTAAAEVYATDRVAGGRTRA